MMKTTALILSCMIIYIASHAQTFKYFAGNLHAHTGYSDGNKDAEITGVKTPAESYAFAKKSEHFDFLGISEHNHSEADMKLPNYAKGIKEAASANTNQFASLYGMEYGVISKGGHVLIYGVNKLIGWEQGNYDIKCAKSDYHSLWDLLADFPKAFATLAHPSATDYNNLINSAYSKKADKAICGVAVMTGPAFAENTDYVSSKAKTFINYFRGLLAAGYHVGPTVDHDNHFLTFGRMASSRTIILAEALNPDKVSDAYRKMRFFASTDWNAQVSFTVNGHPMGTQMNTKSSAKIKATIKDGDNGDDTTSIKLMYGEPGSKQLSNVLTKSSGNTLSFTHDLPKGKEFYYYLEITQADGDKMYSSPVWVNRLK